jgi:hypothetical protein
VRDFAQSVEVGGVAVHDFLRRQPHAPVSHGSELHASCQLPDGDSGAVRARPYPFHFTNL